MGTSTLVRLTFGVLPFPFMARLLGFLKLNRVILVLLGNAKLVQVLAKRTCVFHRPLRWKYFDVSRHPAATGIT